LSLVSSASPQDWAVIVSPIGPMIPHVTVTVHSRILFPLLDAVSRYSESTRRGMTLTPCLSVTGPKAFTVVSTPRKVNRVPAALYSSPFSIDPMSRRTRSHARCTGT
jgi:hypothetical protein